MVGDSLILWWDRMIHYLTAGQTQHPLFKALAMISNKTTWIINVLTVDVWVAYKRLVDIGGKLISNLPTEWKVSSIQNKVGDINSKSISNLPTEWKVSSG